VDLLFDPGQQRLEFGFLLRDFPQRPAGVGFACDQFVACSGEAVPRLGQCGCLPGDSRQCLLAATLDPGVQFALVAGQFRIIRCPRRVPFPQPLASQKPQGLVPGCRQLRLPRVRLLLPLCHRAVLLGHCGAQTPLLVAQVLAAPRDPGRALFQALDFAEPLLLLALQRAHCLPRRFQLGFGLHRPGRKRTQQQDGEEPGKRL